MFDDVQDAGELLDENVDSFLTFYESDAVLWLGLVDDDEEPDSDESFFIARNVEDDAVIWINTDQSFEEDTTEPEADPIWTTIFPFDATAPNLVVPLVGVTAYESDEEELDFSWIPQPHLTSQAIIRRQSRRLEIPWPYGLTFDLWASFVVMNNPQYNFPLPMDEEHWIEWSITMWNTLRTKAQIPYPEHFSGWFEWAERICGILINERQ